MAKRKINDFFFTKTPKIIKETTSNIVTSPFKEDECVVENSSVSMIVTNQLSSSIHQLRFQVALLILVKVFSISAPLSKFLQTENLDLESALEFADMTQSTIKQIRDNANAEFEKIFKEVEDVCSSFDITVSVPRTTSRQKNRSNVMNNNPIEYYRISTFIPFLDNFLEQLHGRFLEHRAKLKSFNCLLPKTSKQISEETFEDFKIMFNFYTDILSDSINLTSLEVGYGELKLWNYHGGSTTAIQPPYSMLPANQLSSSIHQLRFQVALLILVKVFSISAPLSKFLQTENLDLESALEFADMTQSTIKQIRDNANAEFEKIFKEVEDVCSSFDITVSVPRTTSRQKNRSNVMNNNPIEYYRISTFIPFLDNFLEQLHGRFLEHRAKLKSFNCLLPKTSKQISEETFEDFKIMFNFYTDILSDSINLTSLEEEISNNPKKPVPKAFKEIRRSVITSGIQGATNSEIVDAILVFTSIKSSGYRKKNENDSPFTIEIMRFND
ncbi:hypothetical protein ACI65C_013293 [Semiaphis heraclei]